MSSSSCYGSYEELAADTNVDIVYIGNTNQLHFETARMMINAGKHVLVEKVSSFAGSYTYSVVTGFTSLIY